MSVIQGRGGCLREFSFIEAVELGEISQGDFKNRSRELIFVYGFHGSVFSYIKVIFIQEHTECLLCAGAPLGSVDEEIKQADICFKGNQY